MFILAKKSRSGKPVLLNPAWIATLERHGKDGCIVSVQGEDYLISQPAEEFLAAIAPDGAPPAAASDEGRSLWQRILALFGFSD